MHTTHNDVVKPPANTTIAKMIDNSSVPLIADTVPLLPDRDLYFPSSESSKTCAEGEIDKDFISRSDMALAEQK